MEAIDQGRLPQRSSRSAGSVEELRIRDTLPDIHQTLGPFSHFQQLIMVDYPVKKVFTVNDRYN